MKLRALVPALTVVMLLGAFTVSGVFVRGPGCRPGESDESLLRLSGALRVFLADAIWLKMRSHFHDGKESLVLSDARTLLYLEPDNPRIRAFLHWHLAFNMARKAVTDESRTEWYREGLDILERGLENDPSSAALNFRMGKTLFFRSGTDDVFRSLCIERCGLYPVQLAPTYLEKAYLAMNDAHSFLFFFNALENAAHFEMKQEAYGAAAKLWKKTVLHATTWIDKIGMEKDGAADELKRYYIDLEKLCALMGRSADGYELGPKEIAEKKRLELKIKENRFFDVWDEPDQ